MLRGVRERLGRRRTRRLELAETPTQSISNINNDNNDNNIPPNDISVSENFHPAKRVQSHKVTTDHPKQPKVFRNRSLDYANRSSRDSRIFGFIPAKAFRPFHRNRPSPDKNPHPTRDRPLQHDEQHPQHQQQQLHQQQHKSKQPVESDSFQQRNDDSFSSLPSTHASRDPFLNDDVPIEISRVEGREDRPRQNPVRRDPDGDAFLRNIASPFQNDSTRSSGDPHSPPASFSSSSTFRKRSSLWKRMYDPDNEFQSPHERQILKAVALSEAAVKEKSVPSARQLGKIVNQQVNELDVVLGEIGKRIEDARVVAQELPSSSDPRFQALLYCPKAPPSQDGPSGKAEAERMFRELQWTERVWDIEAMVAEKRYEECVASIEKLEEDGISSSASASPRTQGKYKNVVDQLVAEMSTCCAQGGADVACVFAPLLARIGKGDHARSVVLSSAEAELSGELHALTGVGNELTPHTISAILDKALGIFERTHIVYSKIAASESQGTSFFVAWIVEQSDNVYRHFISPLFAKLRRSDPVTMLTGMKAARHAGGDNEGMGPLHGAGLQALLETRIMTHLRKDLEGPLRDAERQLIERARTYASAIPRNWREGPYQSGTAICGELNVLARALEGAIMNLGTETDQLAGRILGRLVVEYCCRLLDMGTKRAGEDTSVSSQEVQEGILETFGAISKAMWRIHQEFPRIPMVERVASMLESPNVSEVRRLQSEVVGRKEAEAVDDGREHQLRERYANVREFLFVTAGDVDNTFIANH